MAVIVNKENDENDILTRRINADLREKMSESSKIGDADPDLVEDSEYVKEMKKTGKFSWIYIVLILIISVIIILWTVV